MPSESGSMVLGSGAESIAADEKRTLVNSALLFASECFVKRLRASQSFDFGTKFDEILALEKHLRPSLFEDEQYKSMLRDARSLQ